MAETTQYAPGMSWKEYVDRLAATRTNTQIAEMAAVSAGNVTKWRNGTQGADAGTVIRLAREVGDEPLGVLVSLGYLTPEEANSRPAPAPDYSRLSNDELLELVRSRMAGEAGGPGDPSPMNPAPGSGAHSGEMVTEPGASLSLEEAASRTRHPVEPGPGPA